MRKIFVSQWRFLLLTGVVGFSFCIIGTRLIYLHLLEGDYYATHAQNARQRMTLLSSQRGDIVDRNGNLLAITHSQWEIGVDPSVVEYIDIELMARLARLLNKDVGWLAKRMAPNQFKTPDGAQWQRKEVKWRKLAGSVNETLYREILSLGIKGVRGNRVIKRFYPEKQLAAHLIGFLNAEQNAVSGVENAMNYYLEGQSGWLKTERDGKRRELVQFRKREIAPMDGANVTLTIDLMVQKWTEQEINTIVDKYNPQSVSIIISECQTGNLLALANYPTFDLNKYNLAPIDHHRNRAITDTYEPGSTFKVVTVSAALEEKIIDANSFFDCSESNIYHEGKQYSLPGEHGIKRQFSLKEVITKSSNRAAAQIGIQLGKTKLYQYAKAFGYGEASGFLLDRESIGVLRKPSKWDNKTITRLPIGYTVGATPIQVHNTMATIANGGILMEPRIIDSIFDQDNKELIFFSVNAKRRVISQNTAAKITSFLEGVVQQGGTAARIAMNDYQVAGKTGTTQKIVNRVYSNKDHISSFSGFFPASDPKLVITVVVDGAKVEGGNAYGGVVAAPAFKNLVTKCIDHLGIPQTIKERRVLAQQ